MKKVLVWVMALVLVVSFVVTTSCGIKIAYSRMDIHDPIERGIILDWFIYKYCEYDFITGYDVEIVDSVDHIRYIEWLTFYVYYPDGDRLCGVSWQDTVSIEHMFNRRTR